MSQTRNRNEETRLEPIFYTYIWYQIKNNKHIPFYVGKGKGTRYAAKEHFNNLEFKRIYEKYECYHIFEIENVSDYIAIEKEIELIKKFGRRDINEGPLINHTHGGDGISGFIFIGDQLIKQKEILANIHKDPIINAKRKYNAKIANQTPEYRAKMSKIIRDNFANNPEYYNKIVQRGKERMASPEFRQKSIEANKIKMADSEYRKKLSEIYTEAFNTPEIKENRSRITTERYKDPEERKKTAEATKAAMAKLPKDKLSRKHLCKTPDEVLIQMTKETHLTQKELAKKFNVSLSLAKGIKSGKHWIYKKI